MFAADRLGHPEDHGAIELEEQHLTLALIQHRLFLIGNHQVTIAGAHRFHRFALQSAHLVDGEDVGDEHTDTNRHDQIHKHRQSDHQIHDHRAADRDAVGAPDEAPVDDVDTHLEGDAGQHGLGNLGRQPAAGQDDHHQDQRPADAREGAAAPRLDVHHRAHRGAGTGDATEQAGHEVAEALTDQFLVGVVLRSGDAVGDHSRQQSVDATEHAQDGGIDEHQAQFAHLEGGNLQFRES